MRLRPKPPHRAARVSGAARARASHPPPPPPSSVARGGCGSGRRKVVPNLAADREGTRLLNLTVLRRLDPAVADILTTAAHVTAYSFDEATVQWSRKGVEGSLFVVKRNTQPRFQFVIMNRRNIENLVEDFLRKFEYQVQVPYILYRNAAAEIIGIWFYDPAECEEVARLFNRIHHAFSRASPKETVSATKSFSDFEEVEVASSVPSAEDTLEQETSSTVVPDDVGFNLLSALFTAAACVGAPTGGIDPAQPNQSIRAVPSSRRASPSATSSQPSRTSSATVVPPDAHVSTSTSTTQLFNLTKPLLFPHIPIPFSQPATADAAFASSVPPPLHPSFAIQHRQSAPLQQPFPLSSAPPLHPQRQQSAPLLELFQQSTAPLPLHPQHRQSDLLSQPFLQSTAPPPLHPQHRQSELFPQSTALPPLHPQHRQSELFPQSTAPPPLHPQHRQSDLLSQPFPQSTAPPPFHPQHRKSELFPQSTALPPLNPQHRQSGPLPQPVPQSTAPPPPYGALLLQPFPPPNPSSPLLAPTASHNPVISKNETKDPVISRDRVRDAMLKLVQNEDFIDMVYWEIVKLQR